METSLKTGFAQIFSRCPKNLRCPKFGGAAAPLAPQARTPMETYAMSSPILFNIGLDKSAIICSPRTYNFQNIPLTICNKQYSYFCSKQIKESINGISVH